jgi:type I restriction-modification system DNA methylase subunit
MALLGSKTVEAALKAYSWTPTPEQVDAANRWAGLIGSGLLHAEKETAAEADFKRRIVEDLLGYQPFEAGEDQTVAAKEPIGSGEVDLALGQFRGSQRLVVAPFELKGPKTRLDAIMPGRHKTPVQQAWEYANDAIGARWVVVSNMVELRLYAIGRGRTAFETFDLTKLSNESDLKRFHLVMCAESLLGGMTQSLLERSLAEDKEVTDQLYLDYKAIRSAILEFVRNGRAVVGAEDRIEVVQKILDRVLFIAFAEDTLLLPRESLRRAVTFADPYSDPKPKWYYLLRLFEAVDAGATRLDIPRYNGGLFATDPLLDSLELPDDLCDRLAELSSYDFRSQVSVSILGHIFEQSITDLERERAEARGEALPQRTRRKREGVVYTPDFVTRFIVEKTIGAELNEASRQLLATHSSGLDGDGNIRWRDAESEKEYFLAYFERVRSITIVDPACGSGAFLVAAFDYLRAEHDRVRGRLLELNYDLFFAGDTDIEIVTRNLYGVDVNAESVEITKLALWLKTAKRGRQLESLDHSIRVGNSIIEDSDFHQRAFNWRAAFPEIFDAADGFDVVLGNPPYVRMEVLRPIKPYLARRYRVVADRADLYAYFYERGVRILKPGGRLGFISSSSFFRARFGAPLREFLAEETTLEAIVDFGNSQLFEGVTTYPTIVVLRRNGEGVAESPVRFLTHEADLPGDLGKAFDVQAGTMPRTRLGRGTWRLEGDTVEAIRQKIAEGRRTLSQVYGPPLYGVKTGLNRAFVLSRSGRDALVEADGRSAEILKPFLVGEEMKRWHIESKDLWLIYTPRGRVDIKQYPAIQHWLEPFKAQLEARATKQEWWELQQAQVSCETQFQNAKLLYPEMSQGPKFSICRGERYVSNKVYLIPTTDPSLVGLLGSKVAWFWLFGEASPLRGGQWRLELREQYVSRVPIAENGLGQLSDCASSLQSATEERTLLAARVANRIADLGRVSIRGWTEWDFSQFRAAVRRGSGSDIPPFERDSWQGYFNDRIAESKALEARVASLEAELNDRVRQLFGLTDTEFSVIDKFLEGQY